MKTVGGLIFIFHHPNKNYHSIKVTYHFSIARQYEKELDQFANFISIQQGVCNLCFTKTQSSLHTHTHRRHMNILVTLRRK